MKLKILTAELVFVSPRDKTHAELRLFHFRDAALRRAKP
jgi:hypothetical protein